MHLLNTEGMAGANQTEEDFEPMTSDFVPVIFARNETNKNVDQTQVYVPVAERKIVDLQPINMTLEA